MVYTVTLNPAIDYVVKVNKLDLGETNRAYDTNIVVGGKGINVSKVLKELKIANTALGILGGFTGDYIEENLKNEDINYNFIRIKDTTRINVKLKEHKETEINAIGPKVSVEEKQKLLETFKVIKEEDVVVVSGSTPESLENINLEILKLCYNKGANVVLDIANKDTLHLLKYRPILFKPNLRELEKIFKTAISSKEQLREYGEKLLALGGQNVIISLGAKGAILLSKNQYLYGKVPKIQVKNSVGAGDSMVAGFLAGYLQRRDIKESFALSLACGVATAANDTLAQSCHIEKMMKNIEIVDLN